MHAKCPKCEANLRLPEATERRRPAEWVATLMERLDALEGKMESLWSKDRLPDKPYYDTAEFGARAGLAPITVRDYCNQKRLNATKRRSGRGCYQSWVLTHEELLRYRRDGLLPPGGEE